MTLTMPPRKICQRLLQPRDEALPQTSAQNQPPTQDLSTRAKSIEHAVFNDIPEVELQHLANNNVSSTTVGSSQNVGGASSTQTNGGALHQSSPQAPSSIQVIQENAELEQIQVEDWEDEAFKNEVVKEKELARVQQEIERLHQEQEAITRRQVAAQHVEARRQHINRERARLTELQYTVEILHQQEESQEPLFEQSHHQNNPNPPLPPPPHIQIPHPQYPHH
jgi:hypothetical protein